MSTTPRLVEITPANLDAALGVRVRPDQEHLVEPVVQSLAEAYVHPGVAWPRLIMDGERAVGFLMAFLDIDWKGDGSGTDIRSGLWRLNIAADEQGKGYGRFAVESVAAEIRRRGGDRVHVTWHPGPDGPEPFYLGLGFRTTGETSGGQTVGVLETAGPKSTTAEPTAPEPTGSESTAAESSGPESTAAEPTGSESTAAESTGSESTGAESSGSESSG